MFMLDAMQCNPEQCYAEFRMYPAMLRTFTHILCDEYRLHSGQQVDMYEQVGMFLCILAHGKGYRQVRTLFNHYLQTIGHYFKIVLDAACEFAIRLIRPDPNYNHGAEHHVPNLNQHPLFENCIGAIDGTHVQAILPRDERGGQEQRMIHACWLGLYIVLKLIFPILPQENFYLVDSGFAHRPGYMAPYKGSDILYHFQQFYDGETGRRRNFRNARERFNFRHSSCRNVIERAFGVWKVRWKILDRMPSYNFKMQTAVVLATMGIHNFLRRAGVVDEAFTRAEIDPDAAEVELQDEQEQTAAELNALETQRNEWNRFCDFLAQSQ
ncbi:uncharacterized protein LOC111380994 [Olea europaea var. sylvestris]|uniref:uncharacterized protein LOC111380994 n=1 Tax=Olea europaea var. sylvestris TaxID=158386 RepID=UPI000C1D2726|nr:uncharacterized protein LOC111380994 [Olea europaea var. sylvestris]